MNNCQYWSTPPGSARPAVQVNGKWSSKEQGRGREYQVLEHCWCYYSKPDDGLCVGLWCCIKLNPGDKCEENLGLAESKGGSLEQSPYASQAAAASEHGKAKGKVKKGKGMRGTAAAPLIPGSGLVGEKRVAWVNAVTIDLAKLQRKDQGFIYCLRVGSPTSYYQEEMDVDSFGDTQARSTTIIDPVVQYVNLPPEAVVPPTPDEIAWGTQERAEEDMLYLHCMCKNLKDNAKEMHPVLLLEQKRMLERSASYGSIAAQMGLNLLEPVSAHIRDNLMICEVCSWGSNPGVQHCPKCSTTFTT